MIKKKVNILFLTLCFIVQAYGKNAEKPLMNAEQKLRKKADLTEKEKQALVEEYEAFAKEVSLDELEKSINLVRLRVRMASEHGIKDHKGQLMLNTLKKHRHNRPVIVKNGEIENIRSSLEDILLTLEEWGKKQEG